MAEWEHEDSYILLFHLESGDILVCMCKGLFWALIRSGLIIENQKIQELKSLFYCFKLNILERTLLPFVLMDAWLLHKAKMNKNFNDFVKSATIEIGEAFFQRLKGKNGSIMEVVYHQSHFPLLHMNKKKVIIPKQNMSKKGLSWIYFWLESLVISLFY